VKRARQALWPFLVGQVIFDAAFPGLRVREDLLRPVEVCLGRRELLHVNS